MKIVAVCSFRAEDGGSMKIVAVCSLRAEDGGSMKIVTVCSFKAEDGGSMKIVAICSFKAEDGGSMKIVAVCSFRAEDGGSMKILAICFFRVKDGGSMFLRNVGTIQFTHKSTRRFHPENQHRHCSVAHTRDLANKNICSGVRASQRSCIIIGRTSLIITVHGRDSAFACIPAAWCHCRKWTRIGSMSPRFVFTILIIVLGFASFGLPTKRREDKTKCPHVKAIRNFDLHEVIARKLFSRRNIKEILQSLAAVCQTVGLHST
jgi:hypothetical protein